MLWKLSLTGIKGRLKDYIVLFSGLVMASAIFYMFQSMASNEEFLKNNSTIGVVVIIFHFGTVLLGIITFAYILYANSFLMSMRQKDYAMFMMLGAKGRKIAQMIFIETFFVGIIATITGALAGIGLTKIVNDLLVQQLNIRPMHIPARKPPETRDRGHEEQRDGRNHSRFHSNSGQILSSCTDTFHNTLDKRSLPDKS